MRGIVLSFAEGTADLLPGIEALAPDLGVTLGPAGLRVVARHDPSAGLAVEQRAEAGAVIRYAERIHFFRGLGILVESLRTGLALPVREQPQFATDGLMIDVSQGNAVPRRETVERVLRRMALMGLNLLMLYAEDSYTVPDEPEFGWMRARYTSEEMRAIDGYAARFGIELVPCIQTLAHLVDLLKWERYHPFRDDEDTLLVGDPRSYDLIERMIEAATAPVRTRRIHIGMDEAWRLGLGRYLAEHGYTPKADIMSRHLERVLEITRRRGLRPMIWSDMYFRAASRTGDYYDREAIIPDDVIRRAPKGATLVYWDYYHADRSFYEDFIDRHRRFGSEPVFAGGIWNWFSWTVNQSWTAAATNAALDACKAKAVREVFATVWGDDANECLIDSALWGLQLFAEHGYAREVDPARLERRFAACTGARQDDYLALQLVDEVPGVPAGNPGMCNPSRYLLWQDPLLGLFDANTRGLGIGGHYARLAERLREAARRNGEAGPAFDVLARLAAVLELKAELGIRLADAYAAADRDGLRRIVGTELPEVERRLRSLRDRHREVWLSRYKPAGWEVFDLRYGAALARLETAAARAEAWLAGAIDRIEELEEPRRPWNGRPGPVRAPYYTHMVSASRLSMAI